MKIKNYILIIGLAVLTFLVAWYEAKQPEPIDWTETYSPRDKMPYGTDIVYRSLESLFPGTEVYLSRLSVAEVLNRPEAGDAGAYVFIGRAFSPDKWGTSRLLEWVEQGNDLFIAATTLSDHFCKRLGITVEGDMKDSVTHLTFSGYENKPYSFAAPVSCYFVLQDTFAGQVLGRQEPGHRPDFLNVRLGKGQIFLNLHPRAFTNRWVLDTLNGDYYYKALSWLGTGKKELIWDAYQSLGRRGGNSRLQVIMRYPALRLAFYLLLGCGLLYMFFKAKREQRPIPVIPPPENKMLGFISMVASLYFKQKDHAVIARKQVDFFLAEVREKYYLPTDCLDENFIGLLAGRSGMDVGETRLLVEMMVAIRKNPQVTADDLRRLMERTDRFVRDMLKK